MSSVAQGGQIRLTSIFYEDVGRPAYDPTEDNISPILTIYYGTSAKAGPFTYSNGSGEIQRDSVGSFSYRFNVPVDADIGTWKAQWSGVINGSIREGEEFFDVVNAGSISSEDHSILGDDFIFTFSPGADPLYIDIDEIKPLFPDATDMEIMELIYVYSLEIDNIRGTDPLTDTMLEYIKAAVACSLSKIYNFGMGSSGPGSEDSITLGDLSIINRSGNAGSSKAGINRGNYANWCEYAYALRNELMRGTAGMKAIVRGSVFCNPIPERHIRRFD